MEDFLALQRKRVFEAKKNTFRDNLKHNVYHSLLVACDGFRVEDIGVDLIELLRRGVNSIGARNVRVLAMSDKFVDYYKEELVSKDNSPKVCFKSVNPECLNDFIKSFSNYHLNMIPCKPKLTDLDSDYLINNKISGESVEANNFMRLWHYKPAPVLSSKPAPVNTPISYCSDLQVILERQEVIVNNKVLAVWDSDLYSRYLKARKINHLSSHYELD